MTADLDSITRIYELIGTTVGLSIVVGVAWRVMRVLNQIADALHVHREHVGTLHASGVRHLFDPQR